MKTTLALGWVEMVLGAAWAIASMLHILDSRHTFGGILIHLGLGLAVIALGAGTTVGGREKPT
jgi:hypothetical protein